MSTESWPDPVDVLIHVGKQADESWCWVVSWTATNWPADPAFKIENAPSRADSLLEAMAFVDKQFREVPVNLYCEQADFIEAVRQLPSWPHVEFHEPALARTHTLRRGAVEAITSTTSTAEPMLVAVDGSYSVSQKTGGWAWVSSDGSFGQGSGKVASSVHAELLGIALALKQAGPGPLVVQCDCQEALDLAMDGSRPGTATKLRPAVTAIRSSKAYERAQFEWVPGHRGNAMNEAANRLAIAARRDLDAGTPLDTAQATAQAIVAEHKSAWEAGMEVPATPRLRSRK